MNPNLLQNLEEIIQLSGKRTENILTTFPGGYAEGWKMQIPKVFSDCLDLNCTEKVLHGEKKLVWSQGCQFRFKEGDLMYDVKEAYLPNWKDAVSHVSLSVQVVKAQPATSGARRDPGSVEFLVYRADEARMKLILDRTIRSTQDGLIRFLITGAL